MHAANSYSVSMFSLKALSSALVLAIGVPFAVAQTYPPKLASSARIDLVSPTVGLTNGQVIAGDGKLVRAHWLTPSAQPRSYSAEFPINHLGWHEVALRFVPTVSGTIECKFMGPWQQTANGRVYRQEVMWDAVQAAGGELANGNFEKGNQSWRGEGVVETNSPAFEGRYYGRAWHNQPLMTTLTVSAGVPITLRAQARAVVPENHQEMRRIPGTNSPGHIAARRFLRGANCGNYLEVPPRQTWSVKHHTNDLIRMRAEGFDHVRIPVGWHHYTGPEPDFKLSNEVFSKVDLLVTNALAIGLNVLLNMHHFDPFTSEPQRHTKKFHAIWRQVAEHYAAAPAGLAFELLNEPRDKATTAVMNPIYAAAITEIRKTNPSRTIFVAPGRWNSIDELAQLILPNDDSNIVVTVHNYEPFYFTHQGASWAKPAIDIKGVVFPGPPATPLEPAPTVVTNQTVANWIKDYNTLAPAQNPSSRKAFDGKLRLARQWSDYYGRPVHVGEFGCYTTADPGSRARYYAEFRQACEQHGIGWAIWDWKAGFKYWDEKTQQPVAGMREALFGGR
jgi:endoglucanase